MLIQKRHGNQKARVLLAGKKLATGGVRNDEQSLLLCTTPYYAFSEGKLSGNRLGGRKFRKRVGEAEHLLFRFPFIDRAALYRKVLLEHLHHGIQRLMLRDLGGQLLCGLVEQLQVVNLCLDGYPHRIEAMGEDAQLVYTVQVDGSVQIPGGQGSGRFGELRNGAFDQPPERQPLSQRREQHQLHRSSEQLHQV